MNCKMFCKSSPRLIWGPKIFDFGLGLGLDSKLSARVEAAMSTLSGGQHFHIGFGPGLEGRWPRLTSLQSADQSFAWIRLEKAEHKGYKGYSITTASSSSSSSSLIHHHDNHRDPEGAARRVDDVSRIRRQSTDCKSHRHCTSTYSTAVNNEQATSGRGNQA